MKSKQARVVIAAFAALVAAPASASSIDLFTVGSTHAAGALDPMNNPISGVPVVSWTWTLAGLPMSTTLLSILAEGIDSGPTGPGGGEFDGVFVNGTFVGYLTQQSFYTPYFNLRPGPGALAGVTAETTSIFDVTSLLVAGLNTFEVRVDTSNWVNEIEVASLATLQQLPEPSSLPLAAAALATLALGRRRGAHARR
jgi:hypothetical protein